MCRGEIDGGRAWRAKIRAKHAKYMLSADREGSSEEVQTFANIKSHARWRDLTFLQEQEKDEYENNLHKKVQDLALSNEDAQGDTLWGPAFIPAESSVRNDYSQHFVDTSAGELPGNAVQNPSKISRFAEYPKLRSLIDLKAELLASISHPPTYLQADLLHSTKLLSHPSQARIPGSPFHLASLLPIKYDVVIIDPPLEAYEWESLPKGSFPSSQVWSWDQLAALPIPQVVAKESFVFLWVGSGAYDGLERGREVLMRWGYRRCEDIVWIQTNHGDVAKVRENGMPNEEVLARPSTSSCFSRATQHCLMGIRGTVRRSTDTRFVHCNIDTDVILWDGDPSENFDPRAKPPEMMDLIENFCLGTRRLELFGRNRNLRRGWFTIGLEVGPDQKNWQEACQGENASSASNSSREGESWPRQTSPEVYRKEHYDSYFGVDRVGATLAQRQNLVPYSEEIDSLRPKSPTSHSGGNARRSHLTGLPTLSPMSGVGVKPGLTRTHASLPSTGSMAAYDDLKTSPNQSTHSLPPAATSPSLMRPGGAGYSGLGAGGPSIVSVPSGSENLSGPQASVLMGQNASVRASGPSGLSRTRRK